MASLGTTGKPPQTTADLHDLIEAINNGKGIYDPLSRQTDGANHKYICQVGTTTSEPCYYTYRLCDGGMGFAVGGWFESTSNQQLYVNDPIDEAGTPNFYGTPTDDQIYEVGSCKIFCPNDGTVSGCPSLGDPNNLPTKIDDAGTFVTT